MFIEPRSRASLRRPTRLSVAIAAVAATFGAASAADHRDGPIFGPPGITITNSRRDINDLFVFRSPANANDTVFVLTVSPFSTATTPAIFDSGVVYDVKIANRGDLLSPTENVTFRVTFSPPDANGVQDVLLKGIPASRFAGTSGVLARGKTGTNLAIAGGGLFRAAEQDDPFFFDAVGFNAFLNGSAFPRPVGTATNFYGPNVNTLAIVLEIPSNRLTGGRPDNVIGVWARTELNGVVQDRMGRPLMNSAFIPPVPRGSNFPIGTGGVNRQERRSAFNAGLPRDDRANFNADMGSVLQSFYGRTSADANFLEAAFLPDVLIFQLGNPNGFGTLVGTSGSGPFAGGQYLGNGRRFGDDVVDITLNLMSNGAEPSDNVGDDNGLKVTDGSVDPVSGKTRSIAFPYIGARNPNPTGLPGSPPPP